VKIMAAGFSEESFRSKLGQLSNSQQSIQTLSLWLLHHQRHARHALEVWQQVLRTGSFSGGRVCGDDDGVD
jgi:hypothetical protein